jgi:hypothetical protein
VIVGGIVHRLTDRPRDRSGAMVSESERHQVQQLPHFLGIDGVFTNERLTLRALQLGRFGE